MSYDISGAPCITSATSQCSARVLEDCQVLKSLKVEDLKGLGGLTDLEGLEGRTDLEGLENDINRAQYKALTICMKKPLSPAHIFHAYNLTYVEARNCGGIFLRF